MSQHSIAERTGAGGEDAREAPDGPEAVRGQPASGRRVVMLVGNPCVNDSRVIKSAEALAKGGWTVSVLCRQADGVPASEVVRGVEYERFPGGQTLAPVHVRRWKAAKLVRLLISAQRDGGTLRCLRLLYRLGRTRQRFGFDAILALSFVPLVLLVTFLEGSYVVRRKFLRPIVRRSRLTGEVVAVRGRQAARRFGDWLARRSDIAHARLPWPANKIVYGAYRIPRRLQLRSVAVLKRTYRLVRRGIVRRQGWAKPVSGCRGVERHIWAPRIVRRGIVRRHGGAKLVSGCRGVKWHIWAPRIVRRGIVRLQRWVKPVSLRRWVKRHIWAPQIDPLAGAAIQRGIDLSPAVVHCHDLPTLPLGARIAAGSGARLVYDSHELEMHRNAVYAPAVYRWRRWTEKSHIRQTDAVITVSESIADHLRDDYGIPRPEVILNAPDFDEAVTPLRDLRGELALPPGTPIAVYVGSVTVNRGLDVMVRSLAHDSRLHFATVGPRRPQTEAEMRAIAEELGVLDRLHFVDPLPPAEVVGYIRSATVSVLPIQNVCLSYYYCMPNKLLESAFAGVPVAVADLVEMRRFVETYRCGEIMDETDPASVAEVLGRIAADPAAYRMTPEHREAVAAWFGWPKQAEDLRNLYDRIAPAPAAGPVAHGRFEAAG